MTSDSVSFCFVTTFSDDGYTKYGKKMLESAKRNIGQNIFVVRGHDLSVQLSDFELTVIDNNFANEITHFYDVYKDKFQSNFRFAPQRFIHKPTAILSVVEAIDRHVLPYQYLIWLDGDSLILKDDFTEKLCRLKPDQFQQAAVFDRLDNYFYCEAGLMIFNLDHSETRTLLREWADVFLKGDIFNYIEWHDAFIFTCLMLQRPPGSFRLLCRDFGLKSLHPIAELKILNKCFDHMKGDERKTLGFSTERYSVSSRLIKKMLVHLIPLLGRK